MDKLKEYLKDETLILLVATVIVGAVIVACSLVAQEDEPAACKETQSVEEDPAEVSDTPEGTQVEPNTTPKSESIEETKPEMPKEEEPVADTEETAKTQGALVESETSEETKTDGSLESVPESEEITEAVEEPEEQDTLSEKVPEEDLAEAKTETAETPVPPPEEVPEESAQPEEHEHSWVFESVYQKPTCSNGGLVNQICAHCGKTQTTEGTPTGEHTYKVESEGDCCSAEVIICTDCNHREVKEVDPENHIDAEDGFCYGCGQEIG